MNEKDFNGYYGKGPKNYIRTDWAICEEAKEMLTLNPWVDATEIEVSVDHGYVRLRGWVSDRDQKKAAEACVEKIPGVKDVLNYLVLKKDRGLIGEMSIKANMI